jgi:hypothetical protein
LKGDAIVENSKDLFQIKKNFMALAIFIVIILLIIDVVLRISPSALRPGGGGRQISAVGYHQQFADGGTFDTYTIFENNGVVYQCWWDGKTWNQKKVTNYKGPTKVEVHE